jgi:photosystem II stability/assembly factor-like uncharacterized protein
LKKNRFLFSTAWLLFLFSLKTQAQWEQTTGPIGGTFQATCTLGDRIFAAASVGVYYSDNDGQSWTLSSPLLNYNAFALSPRMTTDGTTLCYSNQNGVFVSNNQGTSWTTLSTLTTNDVMATNRGIYMAFNAGPLTFLDKSQSISAAVSVNSAPVYASRLARKGDTLFAGGSGKLYRSFDNGMTWDFVTPPIASGEDAAGLHVFDTTLFFGGRFSGFYLSKDWGKTWHDCSAGISTNFNIINYSFYNAGKRIYLIPGDDIYYSDNAGGTWVQANTFPTYAATAIGGNSRVVWAGAAGEGAYSYNPVKNTWTASTNYGLLNANIPIIDKSGANIIAGVNNMGIYYTNDEGNTWTKSKGIATGDSPLHSISLGHSHLIGMGNGLYISIDNGKSYVPTSVKEGVYALCKSKNYLWCYMFGSGLAKSSDSAATWSSVSVTGVLSGWFMDMAAMDTVLYAYNFGGDTSLYRSFDEGKTWKGFTNGLPSRYTGTTQFCTTPTSLLVVTGNYIYRLSADRNSWKRVYSMPENCSHLYYENHTLFALTPGMSSLVYVSQDDGVTWDQFTDELQDEINCLVLSPSGKLFAGTANNSVWKFSAPSIVTGAEQENASSQLKVNMYPNPTINDAFTLSVPLEDAYLEIVDMTGNKIMEQALEKGNNTISLHFHKGIYLVKVSNFKNTFLQKIVLR